MSNKLRRNVANIAMSSGIMQNQMLYGMEKPLTYPGPKAYWAVTEDY